MAVSVVLSLILALFLQEILKDCRHVEHLLRFLIKPYEAAYPRATRRKKSKGKTARPLNG